MGTLSLAIWNMKKPIIAIATVAWGASSIFQIQGKPLPLFGGSSELLFKRDMVLAIVRVNN